MVRIDLNWFYVAELRKFKHGVKGNNPQFKKLMGEIWKPEKDQEK